ncbi:MAG TPA: RNA 2',3'-cyclic phosphodiesterase [Candidatus Cloacimonadota bacterium]|nr:RNA 2',3'-cyclic phosphodiesterase [Candidatus Cloacimonadota bacterium]HPT72548.1 RNA 2',3'-cyclic phosphodiesterase [Candidatus Cloacimonadota bacterium]
MRLFLAFELPREIQRTISDLLVLYKKRYPVGVNWVAPHQMHFTVQFMGEINTQDLPELREFIASKVGLLYPVLIQYLGCEIYPANNPKLVWLKFKSEDKGIPKFLQEFRKFFRELGYEPDMKPLQYHVTLGRIKTPLPVASEREINGAFLPLTECKLSNLVLFESRLTPTGPIYRAIDEYDLNL